MPMLIFNIIFYDDKNFLINADKMGLKLQISTYIISSVKFKKSNFIYFDNITEII